MKSLLVDAFEPPQRDSDRTLTEQIVAMMIHRLRTLGLRPGSRLPSIRAMAQHLGVSRFTVIEAYEQLVTQGWLQARQGAGYFVCSRAVPSDQGVLDTRAGSHRLVPDMPQQLNVAWLLNNTLRDVGSGALSASCQTVCTHHTPRTGISGFVPGSSALLPHQWLDADLLAAAMRSVGRSSCTSVLGYGQPQGYAPLRASMAAHLQSLGIPADPQRNLLLTSGVTHAVDLVLRVLTSPGDAVLVEDPAWFLVFGRLAAAGVRVLGVPRTPEGPDLQVLENLARLHRPRLFIINSAVHNPTGHSLSARSAYAVLKLAEELDFHVFEDDTYGELHPGGAIRLAALDGLQRVLHAGGFSKTLAAGMRVAYMAAAPELIANLTDLKLLSGLTTPELPERVIQQILSSGQYHRHVQRVRSQVDAARHECLSRFAALGLRTEPEPVAGMFLWTDCQQDSEQLARRAAAEGLLLAPGSLFSPAQAPDSHIRFSVAIAQNPQAWAVVERLLR